MVLLRHSPELWEILLVVWLFSSHHAVKKPNLAFMKRTRREWTWNKIKHWFILSNFYSKLTCSIVQCLSVNFLLLLFIHPVVSNSLWPHGLYSPWNSPGQNTGERSLSLLQGIFLTQGLNPSLPHCRQILYQLSHKGGPRILEWVAYPFFSWIFLTQESN